LANGDAIIRVEFRPEPLHVEGDMLSDLQTSGLLVLAVAVTTATADNKPPFKIMTKRDGDHIEVRVE
jgi:hypothetical protein